MFIQCHNREWSSAARTSTLRTAAFIVTASKCAPITRLTILSGNGVTAAARRGITFSSGQYFLEKCAWARTWRTSARALQRNRKVLHWPELQLLQPRLRSRVARLHQVLLRPARVQTLLQPRKVPGAARLLQARHLLAPPHCLHHQVLLRQPVHRQRRLPLRRRKSRQRVPARIRLLLLRHPRQRRRMQVRPRQQAQQRQRRGRCRRLANRRCTLPPGIMYISSRRAVSTSIRTCPLIVSFIERAASATHVRRTRWN